MSNDKSVDEIGKWMDCGWNAMRLGDYAEASKSFSNAIALYTAQIPVPNASLASLKLDLAIRMQSAMGEEFSPLKPADFQKQIAAMHEVQYVGGHLAEARMYAASALTQLGEEASAEEHLVQAVAHFVALMAREGHSRWFHGHAVANVNLVYIFVSKRQLVSALAANEHAINSFETVVKIERESRSSSELASARERREQLLAVLHSTADTQIADAHEQFRSGQFDAGRQYFRDAISSYRALVRYGGDRWVDGLFLTLLDRADMLLSFGHLDEALSRYDEALKECQESIGAGKILRSDYLPLVSIGRAQTLAASMRLGDALQTYDQAIADCQQLIDAGQTYLGGLRCLALAGRADTLGLLNQPEDSVSAFVKALDGYKMLSDAERPRWARQRLNAQAQYAKMLRTLKRLKEASNVYDDLIAEYEEAIKNDQPDQKGGLSGALAGQARTLFLLDRLDKAELSYEKAIKGYKEVIEAGWIEYTGELCEALLGWAKVLEHHERWNEALGAYQELSERYRNLDNAGQWIGYQCRAVLQQVTLFLRLGLLEQATDASILAISGFRELVGTGKTYWANDLFWALLGHAATLLQGAEWPMAVNFLSEATEFAIDQNLVVRPNTLSFMAAIADCHSGMSISPSHAEPLYRNTLRMLEKYLDSYERMAPEDDAQEAALRKLWGQWIAVFVGLGQYELVLDVVARAHGRHTAAQAMAALLLEKAGFDDEQRDYFALEKALSEVERALASFSGDATGGADFGSGARAGPAGDATAQAHLERISRRFDALGAHRQQLREQRRRLRHDLIARNKLPAALAAGELCGERVRPAAGEALAVWVVPEEFGFHGQTFALFLAGAKVEACFLGDAGVDFAPASALERALADGLSAGRCVRNTGSASATMAGGDQPPKQLDQRLRGFLAQKVWPTLRARCRAHGARSLHLVTTGALHALPWQGSCVGGHDGDAEVDSLTLHLHPGPFAYVKRSEEAAPPPSRPSAELPLLVLAHDAADEPQQRLYCVPLEIACLEAVWGKAAVRRVGVPPTPASRYAAMAYLGHGAFDAESRQAAFYLGRDAGGAPRYLNEAALANDRNHYPHMENSACVLGRVTDRHNEPSGIMVTALTRPGLNLAVGALLPVDDLLAGLRTLLVHVLWQAGRSPRQAALEASACMESGRWPDGATQVLRHALNATLGDIILAMEHDAAAAENGARIESLGNELTLAGSSQEVSDKAKNLWRMIVRKQRGGPGASAEAEIGQLADLLAAHLPDQVRTTPDLLAFTRYWMVC